VDRKRSFNFNRICDFPEVENNYEKSLFLTFDMDWANDDVLNYCIDKLEESSIKATFFVTNETPVLERLRHSDLFELGIHPNFNFLLEGDHRYGVDYNEVIDYYLKIVPDAVSVRSHSLTQNGPIMDEFIRRGLIYDVNLLLMYMSEIELKPIPYYSEGFTRLPYFWEDDTYILYNQKVEVPKLVSRPGLKIFDFHPIHVFLNTSDLSQYDNVRPYLHQTSKLIEHRNKKYFGTCDFLNELIHLCK
jgi:hypothetical protein